MANPLRFKILVKMTRIVTETAREQKKRQGRSRSVWEFQILYRKDTKAERKRCSIAKVVARSQLHHHQRRLSVARSSLSLWDRSRSVTESVVEAQWKLLEASTLSRRFGIILEKILDRHERIGITVQWNRGLIDNRPFQDYCIKTER